MNEVVKFNLPTQAPTPKNLWAPLVATLLTAATLTFAHSVTANTDSTTETAAPTLPTENHTPVIFTANYKASIKGFAVKASRELKILESSIFNWKEGKIHPISYRYFQTAFGKEREQSLAFNSTDNTINSDNNGEKRVITQITHTLDKLNYQLQLQQDLLANHSGFEYTVVNKGNLKNYRFETLGEETIDTNSGSLNTIKIKVIRENQEKTTYIWFAKDWSNLLAKLEQYNGDKQTLAINLDTASVNNIPVKGN
jgi:hypothetical protein